MIEESSNVLRRDRRSGEERERDSPSGGPPPSPAEGAFAGRIEPAPQRDARTLAEVERHHILATLEQTGGTIAGPTGAAALLGIPRSTLQHRMRKLGITARGE
jgi:transcriptional regulator with GAF, ATPase, and Fis domain